MMFRCAVLVASLAGAVAFTAPAATVCPEYAFQPQSVYDPDACAAEAAPAFMTAVPSGCSPQQVPVPQPFCDSSPLRRQGNNYNAADDTLNVRLTSLSRNDDHPLVSAVVSAGFSSLVQVSQASLREQGLFIDEVTGATKVVLHVDTPDLNIIYGLSGLPGHVHETQGDLTILEFACNICGPYEVFVVVCSSTEAECAVGHGDGCAASGRRLLSSEDSVISHLASYLTSPVPLGGLATIFASEAARHLLKSDRMLSQISHK